MTTYKVNFTDINLSPIEVLEQTVNNTSTDLSLFGLIRLGYGEFLNENLLHLLENFSCPEDSTNPNNPDLNISHTNIFENPIIGQFWYNSTNQRLYHWDGSYWIPIRNYEDVAANWGSIAHGQQLPRPISPITGYVFPYDECIWSISPGAYDGSFAGMICSTEYDSTVTMQYVLEGSDIPSSGIANYLIIGIKGNRSLGLNVPPPPLSNVTPTPTPTIGAITPTPSVTPTIMVSPSVTPTNTPTPTVTPSVTPTISADAFAAATRLYTSPSPGDPGTPGPGGDTNTFVRDSCGPSVLIDEVEKSYFVSLQNLSGGIEPYTASFRWITIIGPEGEVIYPFSPDTEIDLPPSTIQKFYYGGQVGSASYERINLVSGDIPRVEFKFQFNNDSDFSADRTYHIRYFIHGKIILTDSIGQSKEWYIPMTPTEAIGSNINSPPPNPIIHEIEWSHYNDCNDCPTCGI